MSQIRHDQSSIGHANRPEYVAPLPIKTIEKVGLLKKTENLVLYKKSERICVAVFVVSDRIASEPLRERLRAEALAVFSGVREAIGRRGAIGAGEADGLAFGAIGLASLLELACRAGEVTPSNYALLSQECGRLAEAIVQAPSGAADALDPRILDTGIREETVAPRAAAPTPSPSSVLYKGHIKDIQKSPAPQMSFKGNARDFAAALGASIEDRESKIIEVVKAKGKVSIKDITDAVPSVGEKTVQRALISLVTRGVLKKEGERRWSRYALAQATLAV